MPATLLFLKDGGSKKFFKTIFFFIYISLFLLFPANSHATTNQTNQPIQSLELNKFVEKRISSKEKHSYTFTLKTRENILISVEQLGVDIAFQIFNPAGQQLANIDNVGEKSGLELLKLYNPLDGTYKIDIQTIDYEGVSDGRYKLQVKLLSQQEAEEKRSNLLLQAKEIQAEADFLFAQNTPNGYTEALQRYQEALELFQATENKKGQGTCLRGIALCYYSLNENFKSIEYYEKALAVWSELGEQYSKASTFLALGGIYYIIDDYQIALSYYEQALPLWSELKNAYGEGYTLAAIGNAKVSTGDYFKAIECFYQSIVAYQSINNSNAEASSRFSLSNAFYLLGDLEESLANYKEVLEAFQKNGDKKGEANTLAQLGLVYAGLKNKDAALDSYKKATEKFHEQNEPLAEAFTNLGVSAVYLLFKEYDKAMEQANTASAIFSKNKDKRGEAIALSNIGRIQFNAGERDKAKDSYQQALEIFQNIGYRSGEAAMLYGLATVARQSENLNEAQTQIEAALKIVDSPTLKITEQEIREFNFTSLRNYFDLYIDVLMQIHKTKPSQGYDKQAFQVNERVRARFLEDTLANIRPTINEVSPQLISKERKINQLIRNKIRSQMKLLSADYSLEQLGNIAKDLKKFSGEFQEIQSEIKQKYPNYGQLMYSDKININELQKQLDKDSIILEYWLGEERSYLWLITETNVEVVEIAKRLDIEELCKNFHLCLSARNPRTKYSQGKAINLRPPIAEADPQVEELANTLSQIILKPVTNKLGKSKLLIVGEGALHFIPFAALVDPSVETTKQPLLINHEIFSLPSANYLLLKSKDIARPIEMKLNLFADPIVSTGDERLKGKGDKVRQENSVASDILKSLKDPARLSVELAHRAADDTDVFVGYVIPRLEMSDVEAKKLSTLFGTKKIKQSLGAVMSRSSLNNQSSEQYSFTHLSTYAFLNSKNPIISGISLSLFNDKAEEQDNFLRLKDLYNLNINSQFLVISAGGTTFGKEVRADGFYAFTRGLNYSGVKQTILSFWTIKDSSRIELLTYFYNELLKQKELRPSLALRNAQIAIWEQKRWQSPYYWAAFFVTGKPD